MINAKTYISLRNKVNTVRLLCDSIDDLLNRQEERDKKERASNKKHWCMAWVAPYYEGKIKECSVVARRLLLEIRKECRE